MCTIKRSHLKYTFENRVQSSQSVYADGAKVMDHIPMTPEASCPLADFL